MSEFDAMNNAELKAYVLSHRQDQQTWDIYMYRLKDDPSVIRVFPDLDEAGWNEVEQRIKQISQPST